jgi:hypothetical protein
MKKSLKQDGRRPEQILRTSTGGEHEGSGTINRRQRPSPDRSRRGGLIGV